MQNQQKLRYGFFIFAYFISLFGWPVMAINYLTQTLTLIITLSLSKPYGKPYDKPLNGLNDALDSYENQL